VPRHLFLGEYDKAEQLVLESSHRHREVNDGRLGADFRRVRRVAELRRHVHPERRRHLQLLVTDLHLERAAGPDEVLLEDVVERRVQLLADVFDEQRSAERQAVFEVSAEILVVQVGDLHRTRHDTGVTSCATRVSF